MNTTVNTVENVTVVANNQDSNNMTEQNVVVATPNATETDNAVETASVETKKSKTMKKKEFQEVTITADGKSRKAAFAEGINRCVNLKNVQTIFSNMKVKGYRTAEIVQVIEAEKAIANGDIKLADINGKPIDPKDAHNYFLLMDGQHRTYATSLYNEWIEKEQPALLPIEIPAVIVALVGGESISEYINEINITKQEWEVADYVQGAANVHEGNDLLQCYKSLIKSKSNPNGYPISTLNRIFCRNSSAITQKDFSLLCSGITKKGKVQKDIIPAHNLANGHKFIEICCSKGFTEKEIAKRFLISEFNDIVTSNSVEAAIQVFEAITPNDKEAMYNERKNLDEALVAKQIKTIVSRLGINGEE